MLAPAAAPPGRPRVFPQAEKTNPGGSNLAARSKFAQRFGDERSLIPRPRVLFFFKYDVFFKHGLRTSPLEAGGGGGLWRHMSSGFWPWPRCTRRRRYTPPSVPAPLSLCPLPRRLEGVHNLRLRRACRGLMRVLPPRRLRQRHEDRLDAPARLEAKDGA